MKKSGLIVAVSLMVMLLSSCSEKEKRVAGFAADFAHKVEAGQMDSLRMVYPQIEDADSIAIRFVADSLRVDKTDKDGIYQVNYGNGVIALVKMSEDGKMKVVETRGIFAYPKAKEQFARKTGALKGEISDVEKSKRMAVTDLMAEDIYGKYSSSRNSAIINLGSTITREIMFAMDCGSGYYTLKNTTDKPIKGSEYNVTWTDTYLGFPADRTSYRVESGKDIPANGTVKFPFNYDGHNFTELSKISMKELSNEEFMATYTPTGNEYEEYIKEHGDVLNNIKRKLGDGPFYIKGKIGGKYAVHITLEKGMKTGFYYYDKNGPSAKLELKIQDYNPKTGKLILEEHNNRGQVTGTFNGTLTFSSFKGQMTSFQGKIYDFDMEVIE